MFTCNPLQVWPCTIRAVNEQRSAPWAVRKVIGQAGAVPSPGNRYMKYCDVGDELNASQWL